MAQFRPEGWQINPEGTDPDTWIVLGEEIRGGFKIVGSETELQGLNTLRKRTLPGDIVYVSSSGEFFEIFQPTVLYTSSSFAGFPSTFVSNSIDYSGSVVEISGSAVSSVEQLSSTRIRMVIDGC